MSSKINALDFEDRQQRGGGTVVGPHVDIHNGTPTRGGARVSHVGVAGEPFLVPYWLTWISGPISKAFGTSWSSPRRRAVTRHASWPNGSPRHSPRRRGWPYSTRCPTPPTRSR